MATESDFTANFDPGKVYFIRGTTLNLIMSLIRRGRPKAGIGIGVDEGSDGRVVNLLGETSTDDTSSS